MDLKLYLTKLDQTWSSDHSKYIYEFKSLTHRDTYIFIAQSLDATMQETRLTDRHRQIPRHIEVEVGQ